MKVHRTWNLLGLVRCSQGAAVSCEPWSSRHWYTSQAAACSLREATKPSSNPSPRGEVEDEYAEVDWDKLGFSLTPADYMYVNTCNWKNHDIEGCHWKSGLVTPYANIHLSPAAAVLNYGQGIYEGTKAHRTKDGRILLFRPDQNAARMQRGADRLRMQCPSVQHFVDAVKQTALSNKRWVPPVGKGSLYIRPLLMGSGPILGLGSAPEFTFLIYASPVGNYFKEGTAPLNLYIEEEFVRACRGGAGGIKAISNYAPVLKAMGRAKSRGFSDVLYLDAVNRKYLEEVSSCNIFIVKGKVISTPATNGTILEGVTRKSLIELARDEGYEVQERLIPVEDLMEADEVFCTGTAVGVAPVGSVTYQNTRSEFKTDGRLVSQELYSILAGLQTGHLEDTKGWVVEI